MVMDLDTSKWSGEGAFTQALVDRLKQFDTIDVLRVEDAPASRSEADYNFISNEIFVGFSTIEKIERTKRFGVLPTSKTTAVKTMTVVDLERALTDSPDIGAPDYSDEGMLQY